MNGADDNKHIPLFVDVDGTLIRSDISFEAFIAFLKINPLYIFRFIFWLLRGRSFAKHQVAKRIKLDIKSQPLVNQFVDFLKKEHLNGRKLYLASASEMKFIKSFRDILPIFDGVIAGAGEANLSGRNKLAAIKEFNQSAPFAYAGNSNIDMQIWDEAAQVIVVSQSRSFIKKIDSKYGNVKSFHDPVKPYPLLRALRPHQWSKNLLIFLPICLAHKIGDISIFLQAISAFIAFSLAASAVYLLNDLSDLEADRSHSIKRFRPIASGDISVKEALLFVPILLAYAALISLTLPKQFSITLLIYLVATSFYSIKLKELPVIDIVVLALLYTVRIVAGGKACGVIVSQWLISFSLFLFLSLACLKRYSELLLLGQRDRGAAVRGRGYMAGDKEIVSQFGASSGYLSLLVLVFYVNSKEVAALYGHSQYLWLLCPLVLYWITRAWLLAHRGEVNQDPVVFALTDKVSYLVLIGMLAIVSFSL